MKCTFCGNNVPDGSELCPECGMILSLDGGDDSDITVPAYMPNVFGSEPIKAPEFPDDYEKSAFDGEISAPEYNPESIVSDSESETEAGVSPKETDVTEDILVNDSEALFSVPDEPNEEISAADSDYDEDDILNKVYEAPAYESDSYAAQEESEAVYEAPAYGDEETDSSDPEPEAADENLYESFADVPDEEAAESFAPYEESDDETKITPVIVPVEDAPEESAAPEDTTSENEADELESADDDGDTYISSGKKNHAATIAILCVLLICLVVAGGYIVKKVFPADGTTTTQPNAAVIATGTDATTEPTVSGDETTVPDDTTESQVTEDTTEADTTLPDVTVPSEEPTTEPTTEPVTEPSSEPTTKPTTEPSTRPSTKPSTTRPSTRPSTTRPSTKPSTKPSTTVDPYGINENAKIKKPSSYLSESYLGYTNRKVDMLGGPSSSSDWVQALGKGGEVKVLAEQSGYSYVYSTRFGTYGWIKSSYISDSRPVEGTTSVSKNTVKPDKSGSGELMCTEYSLNLRTGPGKNYDSIKVIPVNYQVKIIGYKSGVSGWAYVTDLVSGKNGWVSTDYLIAAE